MREVRSMLRGVTETRRVARKGVDVGVWPKRLPVDLDAVVHGDQGAGRLPLRGRVRFIVGLAGLAGNAPGRVCGGLIRHVDLEHVHVEGHGPGEQALREVDA